MKTRSRLELRRPYRLAGNGPGAIKSAGEAVFVKAVTVPGSSVEGGLRAGVERREFALGVDSREIEERMLVIDTLVNLLRRNAFVAVE